MSVPIPRNTSTFVGRGVAFPMQPDATGALAMAEEARDIEEAIRLILGTTPGERPMRPLFGCRIHHHIFDSVNAATTGTMAFEVERAIGMWEPRVHVRHVEVLVDDHEPSLLYIDVTYQIKRNNDERNLVFPFYTIPEE